MSVLKLECEWQVKCLGNCWGSAVSGGNAGRGNLFFFKVTLCANELQSQLKPKLALQGMQYWSGNWV